MPASLWQVKPAFNVGAKFLQTVWKRLRLSGDNSPKLLSGDICVVWRRMPGPQGSAFHPRDGRHHGLDAENVERPPQLGERAVRLNAARPLSRPRSPWFIPCLMLPCSTVSRRRARISGLAFSRAAMRSRTASFSRPETRRGLAVPRGRRGQAGQAAGLLSSIFFKSRPHGSDRCTHPGRDHGGTRPCGTNKPLRTDDPRWGLGTGGISPAISQPRWPRS
jgi:hypothetical protein